MDMIPVTSEEYKRRFVARLVEKGYDRGAAEYTAKKWEEATEETAAPDADPECEADECFEYWEEHT